MKKMVHHRLKLEVVKRINSEAKASGRTKTLIVEDAILRRDRFSKTTLALIERRMKETGWTFDQVVENCVLEKLGAVMRVLRKTK